MKFDPSDLRNTLQQASAKMDYLGIIHQTANLEIANENLSGTLAMVLT